MRVEEGDGNEVRVGLHGRQEGEVEGQERSGVVRSSSAKLIRRFLVPR